MAEDPELARELLRSGLLGEDADPDAARPSVSEFDIQADLLTVVVNELRSVQALIVGVAGGSNPKVHQLKGPKYAFEAVELEEQQRGHAILAARMVPHLYPDGPKV